VELPQKLIDTEWQHYGMRRRGSIHKTIEGVLNEDWCTLEEIQAEIVRRQQDAKEMVDVE
jgi:DNA sulfur modification protein DndC